MIATTRQTLPAPMHGLMRHPLKTYFLIRTVLYSVLALAALFAALHPPPWWSYFGAAAAVALALWIDAQMISNPNWARGQEVMTHTVATRKSLALTFDDGPSAEITPQVLAVLRKFGVRATFFVLGENVRSYPSLIERMLREGHAVGVHGDTHEPLLEGGVNEISRKLELCLDAIKSAGGKNVRVDLFRPPYGYRNGATHAAARSSRLNMVLWSLDSYDWKQDAPEIIAKRVLDNAKAGAIVLMHDGYSAGNTVKALEIILPELKRLGYKFDRLSDPYGAE